MKGLYGPTLQIQNSKILSMNNSEYNPQIPKSMYCAMIFAKTIMANGETLPQAIHRSAKYYKVDENQLLDMLCMYRTNKLKTLKEVN